MPLAQQRASQRSVLHWALMAHRFQLKRLTARCELFIMQHYHAAHSSKRILAALSPESQLRIFKCAPLPPHRARRRAALPRWAHLTRKRTAWGCGAKQRRQTCDIFDAQSQDGPGTLFFMELVKSP